MNNQNDQNDNKLLLISNRREENHIPEYVRFVN